MRRPATDPLIHYRTTCHAYDEATAAVDQLDDIMSTDSLEWIDADTFNLLEDAYHRIITLRQGLARDVETAGAALMP